jgi:succinate dehydrogenase / fumarate reductase, flavoprotein subunit
MERYAPRVKDLASRDVVARSMALELRAGKGFDPEGIDHVKLKLDHLGADLIMSRLPGIRELSMKFAGVDPIIEPIPVVPTCHYSMGGIPTNRHGQVISRANGQDNIVEGLYAVGECACVSVHGANRLGGNSLLDLVVFGRAAGLHVDELWQSNQLPDMPYICDDDIVASMARYNRWEESTGGESPAVIRDAMQRVMQEDFGVFRTGAIMEQGLHRLQALRERLAQATLSDKSHVFNTERVTALELDNLMATAYATAQSALARTESRGAHSREDFPERDDANWIKHTLYFEQDGRIDYRPVNTTPKYVEPFEPKERVY